MIIGKYLESNNDFINIMKVCKKYELIVSMYKFNPISDISLFENIQTQHFYNEEDVESKKAGLFQYIYWFNDCKLMKNKKDNEIFKADPYKYIVNNIPTLEKWCGFEYDKIIYDSLQGGELSNKPNEKQNEKTIGGLYYVVIDQNDNVFGHFNSFCKGYVTSSEFPYHKEHFFFSLTEKENSIGRYGFDSDMHDCDDSNDSYDFYNSDDSETGYKSDYDPYYVNQHGGEYDPEFDCRGDYNSFYFGWSSGRFFNVMGFGYEVNGIDEKIKIGYCFKECVVDFIPKNSIVKRIIVIGMKEYESMREEYNKHIINNIPILEEWCGYKYKEILYDSEIDGKSSEIFRDQIINHSHLYFIIIDSNDNVFGHYHNNIIDRIADYINDPNIFMFTLYSNGRNGIKKYERKRKLYTFIYEGNDSEAKFYCCGNDENNYDGYGIFKIEDIDEKHENYLCCYSYENAKFEDENGFIQNIQNNFKDIKPTDLTGNDCSKCLDVIFNPKRLIVIEMSETV